MGLFSKFKKENIAVDWRNAYTATPKFYTKPDGCLLYTSLFDSLHQIKILVIIHQHLYFDKIGTLSGHISWIYSNRFAKRTTIWFSIKFWCCSICITPINRYFLFFKFAK